MNAPTTTAPVTPATAPGFGRLVGTELRRLWSRRFTKVLLGLCVLGYLGAMLFVWSAFSQPTAQDIAAAEMRRSEEFASQQVYYQNCIDQLEDGQTADQFCGSAMSEQDMDIQWFMQVDPFTPDLMAPIALAIGVAVAMAGFILAATFIGAEWSTKNLVAWLFYEPRRIRLMTAKIVALLAVILVLSIAAQGIWYLTGQLLISQRGLPVSSLPPDLIPTFWSDLFHVQLRAMLLVIPTALLGFGLANLIRNTAAATGIAFVYFVIVENIVRAALPNLQPYLFQTAVAAWVNKGGITVYGDLVYNAGYGGLAPEEIHVSNLTGALVLLVWTCIVILISLAIFRRRDIS